MSDTSKNVCLKFRKKVYDSTSCPQSGVVVFDITKKEIYLGKDSYTGDRFPDQSGNAGKVLTTDGTNVMWTETADTPGVLNTDNTDSLPVLSEESLFGVIKLHKISKTGSYNDLNDKPTIVEYGTTEYWNSRVGYVPEQGVIVVYSDYETDIDEYGNVVNYAGLKIGSGNGYVQDLRFVGEKEKDMLLDHISDMVRHITQEERELWNNKLNIDDNNEVSMETLIITRN